VRLWASKESAVQRSISLLAVLAVLLAASGCSCFRRSQPVAAAPMCPPINPCAVPCGPQAVTYGMPATYMPGM